MVVLEINSVPYGSTAKIMKGIADFMIAQGHTVYTAYGFSKHPISGIPNAIKIGGFFNKATHLLLSKYSGITGIYSRISTNRFIKKVKKINPDVIHLHNLHGWYINIPKLFRYIKKYNKKVVWTLHDCWAFTGHCPYFDLVNCQKWKGGCFQCEQYKEYPQALIDRSKKMFALKRKGFSNVQDMTIVTPSEWLSSLVRLSFLKDYRVKVVNNGIDLSVFKRLETDFRQKYDCADKFIVLGVAFDWGIRKGLDVFAEFEKRLDKNKFKIVLVGTDEKIDESLSREIISIHRTQNQTELAQIYSAADLFVNPTREENFPTVNIESLACGTPILTFNTGGSPEIIDETCGAVVEKNDVDGLVGEIERICTLKPFDSDACRKRAQLYDYQKKFEEYLKIYLSNQ